MVSGIARRLFKSDQAYDDREIVRLAKGEGLKVARPNGDTQRIRGSSRLNVWITGAKIVAKFERISTVEAAQIPVPVATIKGRLI